MTGSCTDLVIGAGTDLVIGDPSTLSGGSQDRVAEVLVEG